MPFTSIKTVSGNMIVDGTLTADHVQTDSLTANKFAGATQESYFNKMGTTSGGFNTYVTLHDFDIPEPELSLKKGRHISYDWKGYLATGQAATTNGLVYVYIEVLVPDIVTVSTVGEFTHDSIPYTGYQRIWIEGNYLNQFGTGMAGGVLSSSARSYKNLHFVLDEEQSELVTNGTFTGSTTGWTAVGGTLINQYGSMYKIDQDSNTDRAYIYQAVTVEAGELYRFSTLRYGGLSASGVGTRILISTSTNIEDAFFEKINSSPVTVTITDDVTIPDGVTTVYVMVECDSTADSAYIAGDDVSLKKLMNKTYLDLSTAGGQYVSSSGTTTLYYHPFGTASAGSYYIADTQQITLLTAPYNHYFTCSSSAYIGVNNFPLTCRIRFRHLIYGDTVYSTGGTVQIVNRMTGEQNT